jgi:DNA polymerase-1
MMQQDRARAQMEKRGGRRHRQHRPKSFTNAEALSFIAFQLSFILSAVKKTLYLIDGHSQIFRAYYAPFYLRLSPSGEPIKATFIFTQMVLAILRDRKPDYLAMALDVSDSTTQRAAVYSDYKANREKTPEDLPPQVARIEQIVEILGIPIYQLAGFEADDVIATIAARAASRDLEVRIVSRDKDLYQLITGHVKLWDPVKDELIDAEALEKSLGFRPEEAIEIQTLMGDNVDNIPGIPGVGLKTAVQLIKKYGSAEAVVAHASELTPKLRENVRAFSGSLDVTRKLVTLDREAPVEFDLEASRVKPVPLQKLRPIFEELGFRRLLEQLDSREAEEQAKKLPLALPKDEGASLVQDELRFDGRGDLTSTEPGHYTLVDTGPAFDDFLAALSRQPMFALDTEATTLRPVDGDLVGLSFSWKAGEGYYLPVRSRQGNTLDVERTLGRLKPILEDPAIKKYGQNIKFDREVLRAAGIDLQGIAFDSMVASYLLRPEERGHDLSTLAAELIGHRKITIGDLVGKGKSQISLLDVDTRRVADYSGEDADMTWRLWKHLAPEIDASPMKSLYYEVELPLVEVLADMELEGIRIDRELLKSISRTLRHEIDELKGQIYKAAGREFTIDSPKQLAEVLFDEQKLRSVRKTKTSRSTDAEVLETLMVETAHPLPRLMLDYRELTKLCGTYVDPLPELISGRTGRLHASFHQAVAATGRLSSSDPNIQNIPIRSQQGREIRKAFVPRDREHVLITADYSQIELRILAHLSNDEALMEAFREDRDIHAFVAAQVAGVPIGEVTKEQRSKAKAINFGIIYGQGAFGLARSLGIPQRDAAAFIAAYKKRYPGIVRFMGECVRQAETTGRVSTILGRQRAMLEIQSENRMRRALGERLAVNTVVQGSAADMIKVAMVKIHQKIRRESLPARLLIQVHDELVLEAPRERAEETAAMVRAEMVGALPLSVPLRVDVAWGDNWLEAKE